MNRYLSTLETYTLKSEITILIDKDENYLGLENFIVFSKSVSHSITLLQHNLQKIHEEYNVSFVSLLWELFIRVVVGLGFNPIAHRLTKTTWSVDHSECNRVNNMSTLVGQHMLTLKKGKEQGWKRYNRRKHKIEESEGRA